MPDVSSNPLAAMEEVGPPTLSSHLASWYRPRGLLGLAGIKECGRSAGQPDGSRGLGAWAGATPDGGRVQEPTQAWWCHPVLPKRAGQ